ncbi:MFS transporter [Rhodococcus sp. IEGM 1366]|uniref:MFS transporter n=1 Tax=Rhodococcus sp. IEGM 1366 TaxID=3082223 RepID=UPI0029533EFF|nr:MFS transporter [Rhodococcus sp. IEGM 1366]MDV8071472.1 MFS transporter [Rhodococcus sp. IEGM 1366]
MTTTSAGKPTPGGPRELAKSTPPPSERMTPQARKGIIAACIGNFIEWYEFMLYGYFATVIAAQFFPVADPTASLLLTFAVFGISFLVRPLGGIVFGYIGDRYGRKVTLSMIIMMISGATAAMALVPSYGQIGVLAPILILLLRCIQGISAGGEWMGSASYIIENAPARKRATFGAWQPVTIVLAMMTASLAALAVTAATGAQVDHWGWRIPFLVALPLGLVGLYLRLRLDESQEFSEAVKEDGVEKTPLRKTLKHDWRSILLVTTLVCSPTMGTYVVFSYAPTFLTTRLDISTGAARLSGLIGMVFVVAMILVFARVADRTGRRPLLITGATWVLFAAPITFWLFGRRDMFSLIVGFVLIGIGLAMMFAPQAAVFTELFPTSRRYAGLAIGYNLGAILFGGAGPFVATALISLTDSNYAPAIYMSAGALISLVAALLVPETLHFSLRSGNRTEKEHRVEQV